MRHTKTSPTDIEIGSLLPSDIFRLRNMIESGSEEEVEWIRSAIADWLASQVLLTYSQADMSPEIEDRVNTSFQKLKSTGLVTRVDKNYFVVRDTDHFVPKKIVKKQPQKWLVRSRVGEKHMDSKTLGKILEDFRTRIEKSSEDGRTEVAVGFASSR